MLTCQRESALVPIRWAEQPWAVLQAPPVAQYRQVPTDSSPVITGLNRIPFNKITYCLTLFSKFISSFPHGTCSLSVSRQYLALDETYHPIWAAFPNNPTL